MVACVTFQDLTLSYNSHPATHHLDGIVRPAMRVRHVSHGTA
ncbi:hypothetical protein ABID19_004450 [Mesorhizobium robiniae]|uniref:ABC transporter ATP-binding protein n=1 Tax=Mesorhizobium robiniae TaxID=559315 RepID=A0ABV2GSY4_9HYPH